MRPFNKLVHHQSLSIFPMKSLIDSFYQKVLLACFQKLLVSLFLDFCEYWFGMVWHDGHFQAKVNSTNKNFYHGGTHIASL